MSFLNNKYTKWLVGALVLMNMFLLFAFFTTRHNNRGNDGHREKIDIFLKKELNLSSEQVVKFTELRKAHFLKKMTQRDSIRTLKKAMMNAISSENPDTEKAEAIAVQIGELEVQKEKMLIQHYLKLQAECTPEQKEKLSKVFKKAMHRSKSHKRKRGKKNREAN